MGDAGEGGGDPPPRPEVTQALIDSAFFGPAKQYVRWDTGLHEVFVAAVEELGGAHAAKPAVIRERMGISLLTTAQVKSHLQKYRIRVVAEGKAADAATEAQARAAARLLARQRRPGEGLAQPTRPRGAVPIRGSRQANAAAAAGGGGAPAPAKRPASRSSGGRRKRRKAANSRSAWSDDDEDDAELEAALEAEAEEESRSEQLSAGSEEVAGERGSGGEEGRSAGTTSASPGARSRGGGRAQQLMRITKQESDAALQLEQLVERLTGKDSAPDAATVAGLAARRDNLMAAAAAAAAALGPSAQQPPRQASQQQQQSQHQPYIEVKQEAPALAGDLATGLAAASGSSMLSASTAAAAMQRQAALEQALLEQSMWVQKLAAEVQDLRVRQQLGLPPLPPDNNSFASPFAALSQAAFPGGAGPESGNQASGPPQHRASTATVATGAPPAPSTNTNNLLTCDSALLRLLSTTLGQGSLLPNDPGAAAAVAAATASLQQSGAMPASTQPPSQQQSQQLSQQQRQQQQQQQRPQQQQSLAAQQPSLQSLQLPPLPAPSNNLLTCDSTLLRLLSQSLGAAMPPQQPSSLDASSSMAAALLGGIGGFDMQAALAAAAASMAAPFGAPQHQLPSSMSPFAALTAQAMGPPPQSAQAGMPAALQAAARPGGGINANRQSSLEVLNSMLGLPGPGRAASIPLAAEFLRLCSLPLGADVLPPPPNE